MSRRSPASPSQHADTQTWAAVGLLIAVALLAYANSFQVPFLFDDERSILRNFSIRRLWPLHEALWPSAKAGIAGRPLVQLSLAINYALGGFHVAGYHAVNLTIHLLAALALFGVVRRTLHLPSLQARYGSASLVIALSVALLWLAHPLQTASVTYLIQRSESLMGLCLLMTLYCAVRGAHTSRNRWWSLAAVACCALGMLSKPTMVIAPLIVLLYDRTFLAGSSREALRRRPGLYRGLASTWALLAAALAASPQSVDIAQGQFTWWEYARTQPGIVLWYLRLAFWPSPLCFDYDGWPVANTLWSALLSPTVVAVIGWLIFRALRRRSPLGFVGAAGVLTLAPTSGLFPLADLAFEHRMYLPLACVVTLAVLAAEAAGRRFLSSPRRAPAAAGLLVLFTTTYTIMTIRRNAEYQSALSIWRHTATTRPSNPRAHTNVANLLMQQGQAQEALTHYQQAIYVDPTYAPAHLHLGVWLAQEGRLNEAEARYHEALRLRPNYAAAHNNLGVLLARRRDFRAAVERFSTALNLRPDFLEVYRNLALALSDLGRHEDAVDLLARAQRLDPTDEPTRQALATIHRRWYNTQP